MRAGIIGMGMWVPEQVRTNDDWPAAFAEAFFRDREARGKRDFSVIRGDREARKYNDLYVKYASAYANDPFKGALRRRVAPPEQPAVVGDSIAVKRALEDARVDPRQVDIVMSSALVPDRVIPSNGPETAYLAGCVNAAGMGVDSVCSSVVPQLDLAAALVESGRARYIACVQSHQIAKCNDPSVPTGVPATSGEIGPWIWPGLWVVASGPARGQCKSGASDRSECVGRAR